MLAASCAADSPASLTPDLCKALKPAMLSEAGWAALDVADPEGALETEKTLAAWEEVCR